jgi:membrane-associated protease RseP (regulator of RpoE activity)
MIKGEDVNKLKDVIGRYFKVYDVRWEYDSAAFFCDLDEATLEKDFNSLRRDLIVRGYIPMVLHEGGEHIVYVQERGITKYKSVKVNLILLIATMLTTIFVGAMNWWSYDSKHLDPNNMWDIFTPTALGNGALYFAFPLMLILGIHELGHYFMAKHHGVAASLPFFIPVPVPPLGTFGAFISMREPIPDKKALLDIGVAGPICGFCVAVPVIILGFKLTDIFAMPVPPDAGGLVYMGTSLFYNLLASAFPSGNYLTHPTAMAGWVGLLVTFLNLLPAGQLDGGHVARALFGSWSKYLSYLSIIIMLVLSFYYQYYGWILFIFIIVFIGVAHPPPLNDISPLDGKRYATGAVVFMILIGCFTPVPLYPAQINHDGKLMLASDTVNIAPNGTAQLTAVVNDTGNIAQGYSLRLVPGPKAGLVGWNFSFNDTKVLMRLTPTVQPGKQKTFQIYVKAPNNVTAGDKTALNVTLSWKDDSGKKHLRTALATIVVGFVKIDPMVHSIAMRPGLSGQNNITVQYLGKGNMTLHTEADLPAGWHIEFGQEVYEFTAVSGNTENSWYRLEVPSSEPVNARNITLRIVAQWTQRVQRNGNWTNITVRSSENATVRVNVLHAFAVGLSLDRQLLAIKYGSKAVVNVTIVNHGNGLDNITVTVKSVANLSATPGSKDFILGREGSTWFDLTIEPLSNRSSDMNILVIAQSFGDPSAMVTRTIEVRVET